MDERDRDRRSVEVWPVGDPRRIAVRNQLIWCAGVAVAFQVFAFASTQAQFVRAHSPWQNDPYDVVVSFTMFFVPAVACIGGIRVALCRADRPLDLARVDGVLRTAITSDLLVAATAATDVVAVAFRADNERWTAITLPLIMFVVLLLGSCSLSLRSLLALRPTGDREDGCSVLEDAVELSSRASLVFGSRAGRRLDQIFDRIVEGPGGLRAAPLRWLTAVSVAAGMFVAGSLGLREHELGWLAVVECAIFAIVTLAFLVEADGALRIVPVQPDVTARWTVTASAVFVLIALAWRDPVAQAVAGHPIASTGQLAALLAVAAIAGAAAGRVAVGSRPRT